MGSYRVASVVVVGAQGTRRHRFTLYLDDDPGCTVRAYFASGNGGHLVVVIPDLDMVIASYGCSYADKGGWVMVREYIPRYILPALRDPAR